MYTKNIDVMCFISSDCDFTPMVTRALAEGKVVLGFGERKSPLPFVNACSKFLFLDEPAKQTDSNNNQLKNIKSDTKLINLLRQAIEATEKEANHGTEYRDDSWHVGRGMAMGTVHSRKGIQ